MSQLYKIMIINRLFINRVYKNNIYLSCANLQPDINDKECFFRLFLKKLDRVYVSFYHRIINFPEVVSVPDFTLIKYIPGA